MNSDGKKRDAPLVVLISLAISIANETNGVLWEKKSFNCELSISGVMSVAMGAMGALSKLLKCDNKFVVDLIINFKNPLAFVKLTQLSPLVIHHFRTRS